MGSWMNHAITLGRLLVAGLWILGVGFVLYESLSFPGELQWRPGHIGFLLIVVATVRSLCSAIENMRDRERRAFELGRDSAQLERLRAIR